MVFLLTLFLPSRHLHLISGKPQRIAAWPGPLQAQDASLTIFHSCTTPCVIYHFRLLYIPFPAIYHWYQFINQTTPLCPSNYKYISQFHNSAPQARRNQIPLPLSSPPSILPAYILSLSHTTTPLFACPLSFLAAVSFGAPSPNPHPPSLSCAMIAPAHFPLLNPQHPLAQSASLLQTPVINCFPCPFPAAPGFWAAFAAFPAFPALPPAGGAGAAEAAGAGAVGAAAGAAAPPWPARNARAAVSFGTALPKPQPPSRSWAMTGPAHFPERKPQQELAQSASEVQGPVMNWVPAAEVRVVKRRAAVVRMRGSCMLRSWWWFLLRRGERCLG